MKRTFTALLFTLCLAAGLCLAAPAARAEEGVTCADALHALGLYRGDGASLAEERTLRRDEAAVMLVRLLGGEAEALAQNHQSPFTDVDAWFAPYAGWLWKNGLTKGVSDDSFAPAMTADGRQYATFLLRALGYVDGVDFTYDAVEGFLSGEDMMSAFGESIARGDIGLDDFTRAQCAAVTVAALGWPVKGAETALGGALIARGVFTEAELAAALAPLADSVFLYADGRLCRAAGGTVPLPALGVSAQAYASFSWHVGGDWVVTDLEGAMWIVDGATLAQKCRLSASAWHISLVDFQPYGGAYYFYEAVDSSGTAVNVLRWDGADGVETVYRGEGLFFYDRPYGAAYIQIARRVAGRGYYDFVDLNTGLASTPREADGEMYFTTFGHYAQSGWQDGAYAVVTFRQDEKSRVEVFLGDALLGAYEEEDTAGRLRGADGPTVHPLRGWLAAPSGLFLIDGGLLLRFAYDAGADESALTAVCDLDEPIRAAWVEGDTVFALTGTQYGATGFYAVEGGAARLLLDEGVLTPLGITDLTVLDAEGRVALQSRVPIGMEHYDEYTYRYNMVTGRVEVAWFSPGRREGDMREQIAAYEAQMQALIDTIYGDTPSDSEHSEESE